MSVSLSLFQTAASLPVGQMVSITLYLALLGATVLFFRPLLVGIGRALVLTVRPRRGKAKKAGLDAAAARPPALHE